MDIIAQAEAKAQGLKWYFTGKPCKHGHVIERYVKGHNCRQCSRESVRRQRMRRNRAPYQPVMQELAACLLALTEPVECDAVRLKPKPKPPIVQRPFRAPMPIRAI